MQQRTLLITAALSLLALLGCAQSESEEHAHHEFPEHRPANFKEAVADIKLRSWELATKGKHGSLEFYQFVDIIRWVPEMAADSDLRKEDWETAKATSDRMAANVLVDNLDIKTLESLVTDDVKVLEALVPKAGMPETDLYHDDHDHHHDDH